jgi:putative membrane protein
MRVPKTVMYIITLLTIVLCMTYLHKAQADAVPTIEFVKQAYTGNQFEIASSKIALKKSQNDKVKKFAQMMIDDHTRSIAGLDEAVRTSGMDPVYVETILDSNHQQIIKKLQDAPAKDFDKQYIEAQTNAHKEAIKLFEDYSKDGGNTTLQYFAGKTLPTLNMHKQHLKDLK